MATKIEYYIVRIGDDIEDIFQDKVKALEYYNSLPSGKDKAPSKRRYLEKVETLKQD